MFDMRLFHTYIFAALLLCTSCDDGDIYNENKNVNREGATLKLTGKLHGADQWNEEYTLVIAAFEEGNEYAINAKNIPASINGKEAATTLSGITSNAKTLELCVINRLRERIASFASVENSSDGDTIKMEVGEINVGMHSAIQKTIFNTTCAHCHGANAKEGVANLSLTANNSYNALVGRESCKAAGKMLVAPGDAENSLLYEILTTDRSKEWNYDHSKEILSKSRLNLLKGWIESGAPQ